MKYKFKNPLIPGLAQVHFSLAPEGTGDGDAGGTGGTGDSSGGDNNGGTGGSGGEDVTGLKNALAGERKRAGDLEKQFKQLQESVKGIDPEKYKQFETLQAEAEKWNQREVEIRTGLETEWTKKVEAEQTKSKGFETQYLDLLKRTEAEKAYQAVKGRVGAGEDGITFFDSFLAVAGISLRLNGKQLEVIDANGTRRFSAKDATKPMSAVEYFETLTKHPVLGHYFERQNDSRGGGMQQSHNLGNLSQQDLSKLPRAERLAAARRAA
ncbi:hypothetical protein H6G00_00760 [Leptolyngbya sp. FACHB-541]|uniref:hypothetical protein n=1 Tax=Leptolyngbya sp. FACHB-541 TaxID=2692810 RepID=UPI0016857E7B|nr:hypothetical protein [Leptolyngbya sp. FACHB-541]MBD1995158.1 hypothetical protein [Leptolyngbya sp. FACHB-541]